MAKKSSGMMYLLRCPVCKNRQEALGVEENGVVRVPEHKYTSHKYKGYTCAGTGKYAEPKAYKSVN